MVQPVRIDERSIVCEWVKVITSPVSIRPLVPPLVAWTSVAVGEVLSTIRAVTAVEARSLPAPSTATERRS